MRDCAERDERGGARPWERFLEPEQRTSAVDVHTAVNTLSVTAPIHASTGTFGTLTPNVTVSSWHAAGGTYTAAAHTGLAAAQTWLPAGNVAIGGSASFNLPTQCNVDSRYLDPSIVYEAGAVIGNSAAFTYAALSSP